MTDNYDLDPHEHEAHAENEHAHESKAEAWPDDQPPVDDFADPGSEETATASEEMGSPMQEEIADAEPKKSSALLPVVAGIGGLLFLGAVLYWQFGRSSSPVTVPPPPPLQMTQADVAPKTSFTTAENLPSGASPSPAPTGMAMPAPVSSSPGLPSAPVLSPSNASLPQVGAGVPASGESVESRLNDLSSRIDELKKELEQATQQVSQMNISLASPSASGNAVLEDRMAKIEQQVEQMQHASPVLASPSVLASPDSSVSMMNAPTHKESSYGHRKARTAARKTARHVIQAAATSTSTKWVLRAATPDEAWVAKNESSNELRHVHVGDNLPGIGHVIAIHQMGDSWVVQGSTGTIH